MKDKMEQFFQSLTGIRKLAVMLLILIIACFFRLNGMVSGAEMVDLIKTTAVTFFGSNLMGKFLKK